MVFKIKLADKIIEIQSLYDLIYLYCGEYLVKDCDVDYRIATTLQEIYDLREELFSPTPEKKHINEDFINGQIETSLILKKIADRAILDSAIIVHGVLISDGRYGYMIVAPSGVGKTTRARIIAKSVPEVFIVNGDKPLLKISEESVVGYGTPWCGKEFIQTNTSVLLRSVLFLHRSEKTEITRLSTNEALNYLISQVYFPNITNSYFHVMKLLQTMGRHVKFYKCDSSSTNCDDVLEVYRKVQE